MNYYYHNIIRTHIAVFGSLFSDILVRHFNESNVLVKEIKVPISYSNKDKFIQMFTLRGDNPANYNDNVMMTLPRFAFEVTDFSYNPQQKINRLNKFIDYKENTVNLYANTTIISESDVKIDQQTKNSARSVFTPVTYKMHFNLYLMTNKETDSLQIIEQILPMFTPHIMVPVNYKIGEGINLTFDESINLEGVTKEVQFNENFEKISKTIHTFSFTMDVKFFGGEKEESTNRIIKHIFFRIGVDESGEMVETIEFAAAPLANNIIINMERWYDNFWNYMFHDLEGTEEYDILEKWY